MPLTKYGSAEKSLLLQIVNNMQEVCQLILAYFLQKAIQLNFWPRQKILWHENCIIKSTQVLLKSDDIIFRQIKQRVIMLERGYTLFELCIALALVSSALFIVVTIIHFIIKFW